MTNMDAITSRSATISECGKYRWVLSRAWNQSGGRACWIMLNPSTADAENDDPTLRRCISFSKLWGYGSLVLVNLFALRSSDPKQLRCHKLAIGSINDWYIECAASQSEIVIAAWGAHGGFLDRDKMVMRLLKRLNPAVHCLGTTLAGHPKHPLYVPSVTRPALFTHGKEGT